VTVSANFDTFHAENPRVYTVMVGLARQWIDRTGRHKIGIKALFERARWEIAIATTDPDYKINNNYAPFYARLIMYLEPDLDELFNVRASEADDWLAELIARDDWRLF
jgi:hypothetical protein